MMFFDRIARMFDKVFIKIRTDRNFSGGALVVAVIAVIVALGIFLGSLGSNSGLNEDGAALMCFEPSVKEYFDLYNETALAKKANPIGAYDPTSYYQTNSGHFAYTANAGECALELITDTSGDLVEISLSVSSDSDVTALLRNTVNAAYAIDEGLSRQISRSFRDPRVANTIEYEGIVCELSVGRNIVFEIYPKWLGSYKKYGSTTISEEDKTALRTLLGEVSAAVYFEAEFLDYSAEDQDRLAQNALLLHLRANAERYGLPVEESSYLVEEDLVSCVLDDMFIFHGELDDILADYTPKRGVYSIPIDGAAEAANITLISGESCGIDCKYPKSSFVIEFKAQYNGIVGQGSAIVTRDTKGTYGFSIYSLSFAQI